MASQGLVSVRSDDKVIMKIIAGLDGQFAKELAKILREQWPMDIDSVYERALNLGFGSMETLVVITTDGIRFEGDDELSLLYRSTFDKPDFNPRWQYGTADYVEIIDV
jgi:hypothetical protein